MENFMDYLAIDKDEFVHNRESAAWLSRNIGSVRVPSMNEGIKKAVLNKYFFIVINSATIHYLPKLRFLREVTNDPILVCTTNYTMQEQGKAIDLGADFFGQISDNPNENILSVMALIKRLEERAEQRKDAIEIMIHGDILIARNHQKVFIGDKEIPLNKDETSIFYYLLCNHKRALSYEQIYNYIRGEDYEGAPFDAVRSAIKRLRKKIEDAGQDRSIIENVRGVGYKIAAIK